MTHARFEVGHSTISIYIKNNRSLSASMTGSQFEGIYQHSVHEFTHDLWELDCAETNGIQPWLSHLTNWWNNAGWL